MKFNEIYKDHPHMARETEKLSAALVMGMKRGIYDLRCRFGETQGTLKGSFSRKNKDLPVVGDWVLIDYQTGGISLIEALCERKSSFSRTDFSGHAAGYVKTVKRQVLAANFDQVFILTSMNRDFNLNRIMRFICLTLQGGGKPVVILTKADLCDNPQTYIHRVEQLTDQAQVFTVSAKTGYGMEAVKSLLKRGETIALLGSSGVGKSTLVNAIAGKEMMKVSVIREKDARGRHTTTHRQMIELPTGVMLMDTPGIREIGMWDAKEGIETAFRDIIHLSAQCKFADCKHKKEIGCAVRQAIEEGTLTQERWEIYCQLRVEDEWGRLKSSALRVEKSKSRKRRGSK